MWKRKEGLVCGWKEGCFGVPPDLDLHFAEIVILDNYSLNSSAFISSSVNGGQPCLISPVWGWSESAGLKLRVGVREGVMKGAAGQAAGWTDRGQGRSILGCCLECSGAGRGRGGP